MRFLLVILFCLGVTQASAIEPIAVLRLGATIAHGRGRLALALEWLEAALDVEYDQSPNVVNLTIRSWR